MRNEQLLEPGARASEFTLNPGAHDIPNALAALDAKAVRS